MAYTIPTAFVGGIIFARWITLSILTKKVCVPVGKLLQFWTFGFAQEMADANHKRTREELAKINPTFVVTDEDAADVKEGEQTAQEGLLKDGEKVEIVAENDLAEKSDNHALISSVYRFLMIGSGLLQGVAHGSNDVANAISPLLVAIGINRERNTAGYAVGAGGIALGELCLGFLVMETMGKKLTKIDFAKGFCVQFCTSSLVICGTLMKLPLSTTHCTVGAVFGLIFANKVPLV